METAVKKLYEGMFLVDSAEAAADWDAIVTRIKSILEKTGAEIVSLRKWDERKLAYEINGKARGTYILCYFSSDGERIQEIEREAQLSEQIIRVLILCADQMSQEDIAKDTPAIRAKKSQQQTALADKVEVRQMEDAQEAEQADELEQPESKN